VTSWSSAFQKYKDWGAAIRLMTCNSKREIVWLGFVTT